MIAEHVHKSLTTFFQIVKNNSYSLKQTMVGDFNTFINCLQVTQTTILEPESMIKTIAALLRDTCSQKSIELSHTVCYWTGES